jgi:CHAT domain-containing protein
VIDASPPDLPRLQVEREWENLEGSLKELKDQGRVVVDRLKRATVPKLQDWLRKDEYHIIHFIGHGGFVAERQESILLMEGENSQGWEGHILGAAWRGVRH